MKYKDFKVMTQNEMKNVIGGNEPPLNCSHSCPAGQSAQGCTGCDHCSDIKDANGNVTGLRTCADATENNCTNHTCVAS
ncbi:MAG: bacteriocin [Chitinophagaceae bacterium]|nr:bacteriocin [Chitinophagaceae bacterium]